MLENEATSLTTNAEALATAMPALRLDFANGLRRCLLAAAGVSNAKAAAAPPAASLHAASPAALHGRLLGCAVWLCGRRGCALPNIAANMEM